MAMIYTLVTAAKEWLRGRSRVVLQHPAQAGHYMFSILCGRTDLTERAAQSAVVDPETAAKRAAAEEEAKRQAARAHGTPVTPERFHQWRAEFQAEKAMVGASAQPTMCAYQ